MIMEHEFPLPELESRKLDDLREEIASQPVWVRARDFARANPWAVLGAVAVTGFLTGMCCARSVD